MDVWEYVLLNVLLNSVSIVKRFNKVLPNARLFTLIRELQISVDALKDRLCEIECRKCRADDVTEPVRLGNVGPDGSLQSADE